jgi:gamma-glutamyl:cysteine ligase YbdK (ATP-grasp superfamily)
MQSSKNVQPFVEHTASTFNPEDGRIMFLPRVPSICNQIAWIAFQKTVFFVHITVGISDLVWL